MSGVAQAGVRGRGKARWPVTCQSEGRGGKSELFVGEQLVSGRGEEPGVVWWFLPSTLTTSETDADGSIDGS